MVVNLKIGFMGCGNLAQSFIKGFLEAQSMSPQNIFVSNRSFAKLEKAVETFKVQKMLNNEALIENSQLIFLAMKPQDLFEALETTASLFTENQIVVSLAAGISLKSLRKVLPQCRLVRVMPNTPTLIRQGVLGYCLEGESEDEALISTIEDLLTPLGYVIKLTEGDAFDALTVCCGAGPGYIFELMQYWQEWLEERGIDSEAAHQMTIATFVGSALLAREKKDIAFTELQNKVASKKGVTAAGLDALRELEMERILRYSFEKASLRNKELGNQ